MDSKYARGLLLMYGKLDVMRMFFLPFRGRIGFVVAIVVDCCGISGVFDDGWNDIKYAGLLSITHHVLSQRVLVVG